VNERDQALFRFNRVRRPPEDHPKSIPAMSDATLQRLWLRAVFDSPAEEGDLLGAATRDRWAQRDREMSQRDADTRRWVREGGPSPIPLPASQAPGRGASRPYSAQQEPLIGPGPKAPAREESALVAALKRLLSEPARKLPTKSTRPPRRVS
jgi:hypothetical protein